MLAETDWIADLDVHAACLAVEQWHEVRMRAEAELFVMAAHWADLHAEVTAPASGRALPGMERLGQVGADGTPDVAEFAAMELGALQGMGHVAAQHLVRDALNVRHRHPLLWSRVCAGEVRVWQARKVAQLCASAGLDADRAGLVDAQTTPYAGALPWGRFESLVEVKIVEADPEAAEERRLAAAMQRFVRTGQSSEHGLKTLVARASAGDVVFFVAVADRIAQILALQGDRDPVDVRRSKAIGILANPARALQLLEWGAVHGGGAAEGGGGAVDDLCAEGGAAQAEALGRDAAGCEPYESAGLLDRGDAAHAGVGLGRAERDGSDGSDDDDVVSERDLHPAQNDADDLAEAAQTCLACAGEGRVAAGGGLGEATAFTRPLRVDPRKLLPAATLYVHLDQRMLGDGREGCVGRDAVEGREGSDRTAGGAARAGRTNGVAGSGGAAWCEGIGPLTRAQVVELLGHRRVRVVPVLDLADQQAVDGYEVPPRMAEALHLRTPACASPWGTNTSRAKDKDHVVPFLPPERGGPPGQTRPGNLAPLSRFAHRVKTHGRWRLRQSAPGVYEWRSPHGFRFRVDAGGTTKVGREDGGRRARDGP
jgi:hypothetical protein